MSPHQDPVLDPIDSIRAEVRDLRRARQRDRAYFLCFAVVVGLLLVTNQYAKDVTFDSVSAHSFTVVDESFATRAVLSFEQELELPVYYDDSPAATALSLFDEDEVCRFSMSVDEYGEPRFSLHDAYGRINASVTAGPSLETPAAPWRDGVVVPPEGESDWLGETDPEYWLLEQWEDAPGIDL